MKLIITASAALLLLAAPAFADVPPAPAPVTGDSAQTGADPVALVTTIYTGYFAALNQSTAKPDLQMPDEWSLSSMAQRYFTPALAARVQKAEKSEDAVIDWDIFADGQDFQNVKLVKATATSTLGDKATVAVTTSNFGKESHTNVSLVRTDNGWRIADMDFWPGTKNETTLTAILKQSGY